MVSVAGKVLGSMFTVAIVLLRTQHFLFVSGVAGSGLWLLRELIGRRRFGVACASSLFLLILLNLLIG
jgi:hypothetical protein